MSDLRNRAAAATMQNVQHDGAVLADAEAGVALPADVDLTDSPIPADDTATVAQAWSRVMGDVQWVGKSRATTSGSRYSYRGIDDVKNTVSPILRRHGIIVIPTATTAAFDIVKTSSGSAMNFCRATVTYAIIGPRGDVFPVTGQTIGEAFDSGDKAATKAQSVAERIFYVTGLSIPTNRPELDTEHGTQHEIAGPTPPTAEQYHAEIIAPGTSVPRLRQISSELRAHPGIGALEVPDLNGDRITLANLVVRVGRERAQA